jgi:feruloyl-CoA synthase
VKGPQVTPGYLRRPDLTAAAFDEEGYYRMGDAARLIDPGDVYKGLAFDGRLAENFKLASGTFVNVGEVRVAAVGAIGGVVTDAVVCGEDEAAVGLLFYPNPTLDRAAIARAVRAGLERFNARAKGQGGRIARALVLPDPPDPSAGEITDKGYISQSLARRRRAAEAQRLYADPPDPDVMVF